MTPQTVLRFWFAGDPTVRQAAWFQKDPAFDTACGQFAAAVRAARAGAHDAWAATPPGALALIVLLDQLSRNIFRGGAEAFAADARALSLARDVVAKGWDLPMTPYERMFVYLPFEHSEDLADQDESVRLFETIAAALGGDTLDYAIRHRDVIRTYGRFPHRNAILGRTDTEAERVYLAQPSAGF